MRWAKPAPLQVRAHRMGRLQAGPGDEEPGTQRQPLQDAFGLNLPAAGARVRAPPSAKGALNGTQQARQNSSPNGCDATDIHK